MKKFGDQLQRDFVRNMSRCGRCGGGGTVTATKAKQRAVAYEARESESRRNGVLPRGEPSRDISTLNSVTALLGWDQELLMPPARR